MKKGKEKRKNEKMYKVLASNNIEHNLFMHLCDSREIKKGEKLKMKIKTNKIHKKSEAKTLSKVLHFKSCSLFSI